MASGHYALLPLFDLHPFSTLVCRQPTPHKGHFYSHSYTWPNTFHIDDVPYPTDTRHPRLQVTLQLPPHLPSITLLAQLQLPPATPIFAPVAGYPAPLMLLYHVMLHPWFIGAGFSERFRPPPFTWHTQTEQNYPQSYEHAALAMPPEHAPTSTSACTPAPNLDPIVTQPHRHRNTHAHASTPHFSHQTITQRTLAANAQCLAFLCAYQSANDAALETMDFSGGGKAICIDTGASACLSNCKSDFTTLREVNNINISGIGSGLSITGVGTLRWLIVDDQGNELELLIENSIFVPLCPMNLMSPQHIAQQTGTSGDGFIALAAFGTLLIAGRKRTITYDKRTR